MNFSLKRPMTRKGLWLVLICSIVLWHSLAYAPMGSEARTILQSPIIAISLDSSSFTGFSSVDTTATRVLATGWVTVNLQATGLDAYNAASLRVYTENDPDDPDILRRGMVGQTIPADSVHLKVWTPNFGDGFDDDGDGAPDINNDLNWKGDTQAVWSIVLDKNDPITETEASWNHPLFNYTDLFKWSNAHPNHDFHLPPSSRLILQQPVRFALVLEQKAHPQVYSTQVYFEFALSDDYGETFITQRIPLTLSVTLRDVPPIVNLEMDTRGFNGFPNPGTYPQRVLASGSLTLALSAYGLHPYDAATIRVYTKNDPDDSGQIHQGMVGDLDPTSTIPLKIWTPNFGLGLDEDGDGIPDLNNDTNWRDNEKAVWLPVFDWNQPITETWWADLPPDNPFSDPECAWCHPLFNYTDLFKWSDYNNRLDDYNEFVYHLTNFLELTDRRSFGGRDNRVPLYIAADFTDALPQTYSTTLYIEFALSSDKGETVAQSVIETLVISATVPGGGSPINWLLNRVKMRPDMSSSTTRVEKLADSNQEQFDWTDTGWIYDQALIIMALTAAGHNEEAKQVLNGLQYLQNDDGSWFFSYMTSVTDEMIREWATTDQTTLYRDNTCLAKPIAQANGYSDELEKRVCRSITNDLRVDQTGPWILKNYTIKRSPQTKTLLPDKIKYRTSDFRKFMGANAWVIMAIAFYEMQTGDASYRQTALKGLNWIESYRDTEEDSLTFGGLAMGRVWNWWRVDDPITTDGFIDWPIYVTEHNLDAYSAYRAMGRLTGNNTYTQRAELIKGFLLRELWAPHVDKNKWTLSGNIKNVFFPGINMEEQAIDPCIFLDGQSWSILALGPETPVRKTDGMTTTLSIALDHVIQTMRVTGATIFLGTGYTVTGIDGFKENDGHVRCESKVGNLVWSEGSEGVIAALYSIGSTKSIRDANYYHVETASYMMANGGVPYSTLPANPSDPNWNWTDTNSIAGTAWFYFNEPSIRLNPFQPWNWPAGCNHPGKICLPVILKN